MCATPVDAAPHAVGGPATDPPPRCRRDISVIESGGDFSDLHRGRGPSGVRPGGVPARQEHHRVGIGGVAFAVAVRNPACHGGVIVVDSVAAVFRRIRRHGRHACAWGAPESADLTSPSLSPRRRRRCRAGRPRRCNQYRYRSPHDRCRHPPTCRRRTRSRRPTPR